MQHMRDSLCGNPTESRRCDVRLSQRLSSRPRPFQGAATPWSKTPRAVSIFTRAVLVTPSTNGGDDGQAALLRQQRGSPSRVGPGAVLPHDLRVPTHFTWAQGGQQVELWGSWNNWQAPVTLLSTGAGEPHRATIPLPLGVMQYKYKVDGAWQISLQEDTSANPQGNLNNIRVVHPTIEFSVDAPDARSLSVVGDWDDWTYAVPLSRDPMNNAWRGVAHLRPGQYCYQYIADSRVAHSPNQESGVYPGRGLVNLGWAIQQSLFRIFYNTKWQDATLHYRRLAADGSRTTWDFTEQAMVVAQSKGGDLGAWYTGAVVPLTPGEALEFYISNGQGGGEYREDRPGGSKDGGKQAGGGGQRSDKFYVLPRAGSYKLGWGRVRPFPRGGEPRYLLASDIDGTMIGGDGHPDRYGAARRFRDYWESGPALSGSLLVYNTGRSIGSVLELLRSTPEVAIPDALISAVGTKIWVPQQELGRFHSSGLSWVEDMEWSRRLEGGWDRGLIARLARQVLDRTGHNEARCKVIDNGSEHQHRYAFLCEQGLVDSVSRLMAEGAAREGVNMRIIVSGEGTHRYVDCVPAAAGKEMALQYLREKYGIPEHLTVAAGDSGNDILMLSGNHPSIVVANAQEELMAWVLTQPQDGPVVLVDGALGDGIMEGLARHGLY